VAGLPVTTIFFPANGLEAVSPGELNTTPVEVVKFVFFSCAMFIYPMKLIRTAKVCRAANQKE
jgi:hypothetical protein